MKIAIYSGTIPSTTFIERLILGLAKQPGIEILLVGILDKKTSYPPNIKVVAYRSSFDYLRLFIFYLIALTFTNPSRLKHCFYAHKKGLFNRIKEFVKKAPVIYHRPDIFHIQWAKSLDEWIFLKELGCKVILSLRGAHINYSPIADNDLKKMYQRNFQKVDAFHAVSKAIAKEAGKYAATPLNYKVVYSGLNLALFPFTQDKANKKEITILSIGRAHWIKGYNISLDAIAKLIRENPDALIRYEIIGGVNEELTYQIDDLNLHNHVTITPGLPFNQIIEKIHDANIILLPSVEEGIANVVLEAMALGTLVVSSNCGGMSEVIQHQKTGFLFENRNTDDLAKVLKQAITLDKVMYQNIIQQARTIIENQHNENKMIRDILSLYQNTLN